MEIKIGDFGFAVQLDYDEEKRKTICGTPNYIAPEIINEQPYSYEVDIWSLGIIIYTLIFGKPPFDSKEEKKVYKKIKKLQYSFPEDIKIPKEAKDLIQQILVLDPSKRLTLEQILNHDFFKTGNAIPRILPPSTMTIKPDIDFIYKYILKANENISLKNNEEFEKDKNKNNDEDKKIKEPNIWIKQWIDYSSKYGLGYILNDGNCGVFFNDKTKIILNKVTNKFYYIYIKEGEKEEYNKYDFNDYPNEIENKVSLLTHFQKFFKMNNNNLETYLQIENEKKYEEKIKKQNEEENKNKVGVENEEKPLIYIKNWMRTKHAIIFSLTNKLIQYIFLDNSEFQISNLTKTFTYVNRRRERFTYPLNIIETILNNEIKIKFKYVKGLMNYMKAKKINSYRFFDIYDETNNNYVKKEKDKKIIDENNQRKEGKEKVKEKEEEKMEEKEE